MLTDNPSYYQFLNQNSSVRRRHLTKNFTCHIIIDQPAGGIIYSMTSGQKNLPLWPTFKRPQKVKYDFKRTSPPQHPSKFSSHDCTTLVDAPIRLLPPCQLAMNSSSSVPIQVKVLFFARARELAETTETTLSLPYATTLQAAFKEHILARYPTLAPLVEHVVLALNEEYLTPGYDKPLSDGDQLAIIPPISGG